MDGWQPIETALMDETQVLVARFSPDSTTPDYVVSAMWGTAMPSYVDLASYSGWFVDGVPLVDPPQHRRRVTVAHGIVSQNEWASMVLLKREVKRPGISIPIGATGTIVYVSLNERWRIVEFEPPYPVIVSVEVGDVGLDNP